MCPWSKINQDQLVVGGFCWRCHKERKEITYGHFSTSDECPARKEEVAKLAVGGAAQLITELDKNQQAKRLQEFKHNHQQAKKPARINCEVIEVASDDDLGSAGATPEKFKEEIERRQTQLNKDKAALKARQQEKETARKTLATKKTQAKPTAEAQEKTKNEETIAQLKAELESVKAEAATPRRTQEEMQIEELREALNQAKKKTESTNPPPPIKKETDPRTTWRPGSHKDPPAQFAQFTPELYEQFLKIQKETTAQNEQQTSHCGETPPKKSKSAIEKDSGELTRAQKAAQKATATKKRNKEKKEAEKQEAEKQEAEDKKKEAIARTERSYPESEDGELGSDKEKDDEDEEDAAPRRARTKRN